MDLVNPEDPNVIAENELLGAAASIEAAARKLAELKPRARPKVYTNSIFERAVTGLTPICSDLVVYAQRKSKYIY